MLNRVLLIPGTCVDVEFLPRQRLPVLILPGSRCAFTIRCSIMGPRFLVVLGCSSGFPLSWIFDRFRLFGYRLYPDAIHLLCNPSPATDVSEASSLAPWPVLSWKLGVAGERFASSMDWIHAGLLQFPLRYACYEWQYEYSNPQDRTIEIS